MCHQHSRSASTEGGSVHDLAGAEATHVPCLQDSPSIEHCTIAGHTEKVGIHLPAFQCAPGTTSLESFHLHLARYFQEPQHAINSQAYLVDGLVRWNCARAMPAHEGQDNVRTLHLQLQRHVNVLMLLEFDKRPM